MVISHQDLGIGAPVVVFLHAFPLDGRMWNAQLETCRAASARAIVVDLRGFGASRSMTAPRSVLEHAEDVASLLDERGVERAIVVGLSIGGYIALALAARHARRLSGILLADTNSKADSDDAKAGRAANIERVKKTGVASVFDGMRPKVVGARTTDATLAALRAIAAEQPVDSVVATLEALRDRPDRTSELSAIRVPTHIVVGSDDSATPPADARAMRDEITGAKLLEIEGAGHFTNFDDRSAFDATLLDLIRTVGRG